MDFHYLVMEKSWKINVEKEGAPWFTLRTNDQLQLLSFWLVMSQQLFILVSDGQCP